MQVVLLAFRPLVQADNTSESVAMTIDQVRQTACPLLADYLTVADLGSLRLRLAAGQGNPCSLLGFEAVTG